MNILNFFGFKTAPFVPVEAGGFFYVFSTQSRVMARILSFLNGEKGLLFLVGKKGTGKTSVVKRAIEYIPIDSRKVVYITIPTNAGVEWIVRRLNKVAGAEGSLANLASLFDIVIIDGFEGASEKGDIEQELSASSASVLLITRERVKGKNGVELEPPPASELKKYIQGYLNYAGGSSEIFTGEAIDSIVEFSNGDIDLLNRLAWSSLYQAYLSSLRKVTEKEVEIAYMEFSGVAEKVKEEEAAGLSSEELIEETTSGGEASEITEQGIQEEGISVEAVSEEMEEAEGTSAELETLLKELEGEEGVMEESENVEVGEVTEEIVEEESEEETPSGDTGEEIETEVSFEEFGEIEGGEEIEVSTEDEGKGEEVEVEEGGEEEEIEELLDQLGVEDEEIEVTETESGEIEVESVEEEMSEQKEEKGGEEGEVDVDSLLEELGVEEGEKIEEAIEVESEEEGGEAELEVEAEESGGEEDLDAILSEFEEESGAGGEDRLKEYEDEEVDALFKEITVEEGEEKVEEKEEKKEKKGKKKKGDEELEDEELKKLLDELDFDDL